MFKISLLYFDGCPSWKPALENLKTAVGAEKIPAEISLVNIEDTAQAQVERFPGLPSILVNGVDLWPIEPTNYALSCRVYKTPSGMMGSPTIEMLRERLREVTSSTDNTI